MKRSVVVLLILFLMVSIFSGCSNTIVEQGQVEEVSDSNVEQENEDYVDFKDALGENVKIKRNPQRVICLYNSYLDLWYDAGGEVIGTIESKTNIPEAAKNAELVGTMSSPNVEKILSLEPDLIILRPGMGDQKDLISILKQNDISYIALEYDNFQQYMDVMKLFTDINNRQDIYEETTAKIKEKIDDIISRVPQDEEPKVLLMFATTKGVSAKLPDSFVGDMLEDLGTKNIAFDAKLSNEEMEIFSMEKVVERDPDFILVQTMGDIEKTKEKLIKDVESNPAWGSLRAVKEGRYIFLPKDLYLYKPNSRYAEAYEGLAKILYPEIFE